MVCPEESFCVFRRLRPEGSRGASEKPPCFSAGIFIPRGVFRQLRPEGDWGRAESPQCARRRKLLPRRGLTRRLRREGRACSLHGVLIYFGGDPKEFRQTTSGTHGSAGRADCLPRGKPPACIMGNNFAARNSPLRGLDAPTPARIGTGRPMGRSHFSFGGERKVCKRKPAARQLLRPAPLRVAGFGLR